ncbi:MAG: S8 family serine peptidase [Candidatus Aminicenantaceae bacterium]
MIRTIIKSKKDICIGLALVTLVFFISPSIANSQNLAPIDGKKNIHPKMESYVYRLFKTYYYEGIEKAKEFAQKREIHMEGDLVQVVFETAPNHESNIQSAVRIVEQKVESLGGIVQTSARNLVQTLSPVSALKELADLKMVKYVRLPIRPIPLVYKSEGVSKTGANLWHSMDSYRSTDPVKVCVLDAGFKNYSSILGTELPSSVDTKTFSGNLSASKHGTACAEIVHDMAPDANLLLVNFATLTQHHNAIDWLKGQDVDVVSYSMGWYNAGAGDGTGPVCEDVKEIANGTTKWVSAAGNSAEDHWQGVFNSPDGDKWHNFSGGEETIDIDQPAYYPIYVYLNWNDWGNWNGSTYSGSNQDYDLYLYVQWGSGPLNYVDSSTNNQTGSQWPTEYIGGWYCTSSCTWHVAIWKYSATKNCKLEIFTRNNVYPIEYNKALGSLTIPADSNKAIAVGAVDWSNDSYHDYSSRGPTSDNKVKPDLCAPAGVSTWTYGTKSFSGTSAATPHVAGAIALLYGKTPYSLNQIEDILYGKAKDLGVSGKDNKFGWGRLKIKK